MTSEVFAPAKINLTLHVTGQNGDGYHLLDSLVLFADVGDRMRIEEAPKMSLEVTGPFSQGVPTDRRNLVWQAAELADHICHIKLEKNLPHGGGLGGGSSDAAAMLRHFGVIEGVATLGADVPVCLAASAQRMQGIGGELSALNSLPSLFAILVNPGVHVATPDVFKALKVKENPPMPQDIPAFANAASFIDWLKVQRNDLEPAAIKTAPEIAMVLGRINQCPQVKLARMSGSGSTCFGLCTTKEDAVASAALLGQQHLDWWVSVCGLS